MLQQETGGSVVSGGIFPYPEFLEGKIRFARGERFVPKDDLLCRKALPKLLCEDLLDIALPGSASSDVLGESDDDRVDVPARDEGSYLRKYPIGRHDALGQSDPGHLDRDPALGRAMVYADGAHGRMSMVMRI